MVDQISSDSEQKFIYTSFNQISTDTLIVIKDQDNNIIAAFKTARDIQNLLYSSEDLNYETYKIYTGGTISGEETNGLYTKINSYTGGTEITTNNATGMQMPGGMQGQRAQNDISNIVLIILVAEVVSLAITMTIYIKGSDKKKNINL